MSRGDDGVQADSASKPACVAEAPVFSALEREVIALAANSQRECTGLGGNLIARTGVQLLRILVPDTMPRPLANDRLEALRVLACASFIAGGRAPTWVVSAALAAGVSKAQVSELTRMAAIARPSETSGGRRSPA